MTACSPSSRRSLVEVRACGARAATASLDDVCARRPGRWQVGTKKRYCGRTKKLTKGLAGPVRRRQAAARTAAADLLLTQGVPRATTVLTKISSFLAQAIRAALCSFPVAMSRL